MRRTDVGLETGLVDQIDIMRAYLIEFTTQLVRIPPITTLWNMYGTLVLAPPVLCPLPKTGLRRSQLARARAPQISSESSHRRELRSTLRPWRKRQRRRWQKGHAINLTPPSTDLLRVRFEFFFVFQCFSFTLTAPYK